MKTNKHQTLLLTKKKNGIRAQDLVKEFTYTPGTARSYLSYLMRQGLFHRTSQGHELTKAGQDRLQFFEVSGCSDPDCPLCQGKTGNLTCPRCGYQFPQKDARLRPACDFLLVWRPAGIHCPLCWSQIYTEEQARLMGLTKEAL